MLLTASNLFQIVLIVLSTLLGSYLLIMRRPLALAVFFIAFAIQNSCYLLNSALQQLWLPDFGASFRFIYGASIYFTVRELLYRDFHYRWIHLFHLLPFVIGLAWRLSPFSDATKILQSVCLSILLIAYLIACYRLLNRYDRVIEGTRADGTSSLVIGLRRILQLYTALLIFEFLRYGIGLSAGPYLYFIMHYLFTSIAIIGLATLVLIGLQRPSLLPSINNEDIALTEAIETSALTTDTIESANAIEEPIDQTIPVTTSLIVNETSGDTQPKSAKSRTIDRELDYQLNRCMLEDKPFLDTQITVRQLADQLQITARALSELINDAHNCNFSEFINKARVAEAQRLMQSSQWAEQSLLDIALSSGFNSKTSFNTMFRRYTGQTPSDYRRQLESSLKS